MAEYFKVEKDDKHYILHPTSYVIENYEARAFPFCYTSLIIGAYNFSFKDFYKYIISKFDAKISVEKQYPYFRIYFCEKKNADKFHKELNSRIADQHIL